MKLELKEMGLGIRTDWITPASSVFRPNTWPPARDWPVSIDRDGIVVSRWGDPFWDLTPMAGTTFTLNFCDGPNSQAKKIDPANADLLRLIMTWRMWGPRAAKKTGTLSGIFNMFRPLVTMCSRNGILACDVMHFPKLLEQFPKIISKSSYESTIAEFHRLYDARSFLGFVILDLNGLKRLANAKPDHETVQTPYIPPRIWAYQVHRLSQCLDDFLKNRDRLEECFKFCLDAYIDNYGSLPAALDPNKNRGKAPFTRNAEKMLRCVYLGSFAETADRFGITPLLLKWLGVERAGLAIGSLSAYFSMVTMSGLAYVANFTLQRKEEVSSLRASCLIWEEDEKLGRIPIICGETTKTISDSDARWVASPSVEKAITSLTAIARLRMICDQVNPIVSPTQQDIDDPFLYSAPSEPWGSGKATKYYIRRKNQGFAVLSRYSAIFDFEQLRITPDDLKIARQLTPNLPSDKFAVGNLWPLSFHQFRRTSAVNMFASTLISDCTMQQLLKHSSRLMPLYYGRGYTRLKLNEEVEAAVISAMYEAMARQLRDTVGDRYVSPHPNEPKQAIVVNLVSMKDVKTLTTWAENGRVSFRENRVGACMKAGACEYGGVESIARCTGGNGAKPCSDALFDRRKEPQIRADLQHIDSEMSMLSKESPRYKALLIEREGMENYLNVIHT